MFIPGTSEFLLFSLIIARMSGFVFFNPIFGRSNIPNLFKSGLTVLLAIIIFPIATVSSPDIPNSFMFAFLVFKEMLIGFLIAIIMYFFEMVPLYAGTAIDFKMGISMATIYDPQTGAQVAVTGNILQLYYLLLFFAVDGHLALFKILITSYEVVPYAAVGFSQDLYTPLVMIFAECMSLAIKLAFPLLAFELICEIAIGLLMRIISQINLFILSIQIRIVVGLILLLFLISPMGEFLTTTITIMISRIQDVLLLLS